MQRWLAVLTMGLILALTGHLALADTHPFPPAAAPHWTPVPGAPGVEYAPNMHPDVFRYGGSYYCLREGAWHLGRAAQGPWGLARSAPPVLYRIQAPYFKNPPGWARGKKTGWGGALLPPGQMKKCGSGPLPPGQKKKFRQ